MSVGEVLSAVEVVRGIGEDLPHTPIYVSCSTLAGRYVAEAKLGDVVDGIFFAPIDMCWAVRRVLRRIRPSVLVVLETEIWPNLYRETKRSGASVVVVNGRISDKAVKKYTRFRWFFRAAFAYVDDVLVQSAQEEQRFAAAGAPRERIRVTGNLKYDFQPKPASAPREVVAVLRHPMWIAASTTGPILPGDPDEDDAVIASFAEVRKEWPDSQLVVAPRKPERFDVVEAKLRNSGIPYVRRSALKGKESVAAILLDSVGELGSLFPEADVVFMGGTLASRGGHNLLEPALCGKPVICGPHLENFAAIRDRFAAASGYVAIDNCDQLTTAVRTLLRDPGLQGSLGARAKALAEAERGATSRVLRVIAEKRWSYVPKSMPSGLLRPGLALLSQLWSWGGRRKLAAMEAQALSTPVVSIGGLAMGGVGKTPMARYLVDLLRARGYEPAVLTRGYGRHSSHSVCLPKGSRVAVGVTGDEAQMLLRSADVGIGADRWAVGVEMEKQFHPAVFLLDDGFQHARLERNVDILLLDGIDPLAGDAVFPLGRLREEPAAMRRADVIVITRAGQRRFDGLLQRLPKRPVFLADVELNAWAPERPPLDAVAAFCGLANPDTFFETLRDAGATLVATTTFGDHHRYTRDQLFKLAQIAIDQGASALVTTEKDFINMPEHVDEVITPLKLYYIQVRIRIRNENEFLTRLELLLDLPAHSIQERSRF